MTKPFPHSILDKVIFGLKTNTSVGTSTVCFSIIFVRLVHVPVSKAILKGSHFELLTDSQSNPTTALKGLSENYFQ
jgi:hypothetical protein